MPKSIIALALATISPFCVQTFFFFLESESVSFSLPSFSRATSEEKYFFSFFLFSSFGKRRHTLLLEIGGFPFSPAHYPSHTHNKDIISMTWNRQIAVKILNITLVFSLFLKLFKEILLFPFWIYVNWPVFSVVINHWPSKRQNNIHFIANIWFPFNSPINIFF